MTSFESKPKPRVVVTGEVMLDEYLHGVVSRLSPEAPVPVVESERRELAPGGAGNVAQNLVALGCDVTLVSTIGDDLEGARLRDVLAGRGVDASRTFVLSGRPTTHKLRIVAQGRHLVRIDREERAPIDELARDTAVAHLAAALGGAKALVISDYQKGFSTPELVVAAIELARAGDLPVVVDPKGADYRRYRGCLAMTPNLQELQLATGLPVGDEAERRRAAERLLEQTGASAVVVTCGKEGMLVVQGKSCDRIAAAAREVYDVTGAGDTVVAGLTVGLLRGLSFVEAARLANSAAGVVVGKLGTATATLGELSDVAETKVVGREALVVALGRARAAGRRIVFTNGCFDLLHAGHVDLLARARAFADVLVVGLNSDASVRRQKGPERPVVDEAARARVLAALGCVDYVVLFDESTPQGLIELVRPEVLVKGADYRRDEVVGRELVESYGGRVELVELSPGWSTSGLIDELVARHGHSMAKSAG
jgi:D-beta-D-heptose 7-phosphate kinase / D-beta-D-heptose 1-phosphate adenosyltransferase